MTTEELERQVVLLQRQVKDLTEIVQTLKARSGRELAMSTIVSDGEDAGSLRDVFCFGLQDEGSGSDPEYAGQLCLKRDLWMCDEKGRAAKLNMMYNEFYGDDVLTPLFVAGWSW